MADQKKSVEHLVQASSRSSLADGVGVGVCSIDVADDSGMYEAINRGLNRARGDFVLHLNCDEQLLPGSLAAVEAFFRRHPQIDVVFGDVVGVYHDGSPAVYKRAVVPTLAQIKAHGLSVFTCATFFRRSVVDAGLRYPDNYKIIGDYAFTAAILASRFRCASLNRPTSAFTILQTNLGYSEKRGAEEARWRAEPPTLSPLRARLERYRFGCRKLLRGGYQARTLTYEIFTQASPGARVPFGPKRISSVWPSFERIPLAPWESESRPSANARPE